MNKISAIICVYNEEETIKNVVTTVCDHFFDEVVVINDGSTDKTDEIVKGINDLHNLKYISLPKNKGKGYAMAIGVEKTIGDIIVFIDADLSKLMDVHFFQLITPMIRNEADMVLGQATVTLINHGINPFKSLTGERALLKKDILPIVDKMRQSRFGVETLINLYFQSQGKRIKYVMLRGLAHPTKFQKTSVFKASKQFISEGKEIVITALNNYDLIIKSIRNLITG